MKYYFIHIPKTGGISFWNSVLNRAFTSIITTDEFDFEKLQYECWNQKRPIGEIIQDFTIRDFDLLAGHMCWGGHKAFSGEYTYVTIIRNPVDHIKSWVTTLWTIYKESRLLPSEIIQSNRYEFDNYQTRMLLEDGYYIDKITEKHTEQAIENLKSNFLVGTTDKLDKLIRETSELFGIKPVYKKDNITIPGNKLFNKNKLFECIPYFSDDILSRLVDKNFSDVAIYNYVNEL